MTGAVANVISYGMVWRVILLLAIAAAMLVSWNTRTAHGDVSGTRKGHGFTAQGALIGETFSHNDVTLPPGGTEGSNLDRSAGTATLTADNVIVNCSGTPSGAAVTASCSSLVEGLNFGAAGQQIVGATLLRAQSNSADSGGGAISDDNGTIITGLCVVQVLLGPCNPVTGPTTVPVDLAGIVTGSVVVLEETPRSSDGSVNGSGLTVTMLHIDLTVLGEGAVVLDIAQADSFVGGVTQSQGSTPSPTPSGPIPTPAPPGGGPGTPPGTTSPSGDTSITGVPQNLPRTGGRAETDAGDGRSGGVLAGLVLATFAAAGTVMIARKMA